jgi:hypothetical protein
MEFENQKPEPTKTLVDLVSSFPNLLGQWEKRDPSAATLSSLRMILICGLYTWE